MELGERGSFGRWHVPGSVNRNDGFHIQSYPFCLDQPGNYITWYKRLLICVGVKEPVLEARLVVDMSRKLYPNRIIYPRLNRVREMKMLLGKMLYALACRADTPI